MKILNFEGRQLILLNYLLHISKRKFFHQVSTFRKSAWEYNSVRGQYYLHKFVIGQPDLNYRSTRVQQEMKVRLLIDFVKKTREKLLSIIVKNISGCPEILARFGSIRFPCGRNQSYVRI